METARCDFLCGYVLSLQHELRGAAGALDDPSDEGVINLRLWRERLDEGLPGEPKHQFVVMVAEPAFGAHGPAFVDIDSILFLLPLPVLMIIDLCSLCFPLVIRPKRADLHTEHLWAPIAQGSTSP